MRSASDYPQISHKTKKLKGEVRQQHSRGKTKRDWPHVCINNCEDRKRLKEK